MVASRSRPDPMRVAVISDIHANLPALEATADAIDREGVDQIWCLGDLVGYGPHPNECCAWTQEHAAVCLSGNHDLGVTGALPLDDFAGDAAAAARWAQSVLDPGARAFLSGLASSAVTEGVGLYHGSPRDPVWEYVTSLPVARTNLAALETPIGLHGHTHLPMVWIERDGRIDALAPMDGSTWRHETGRALLNPGSVGQPRDGDPKASWLELDTETGQSLWRRVAYDIATVREAIADAGLPRRLGDRLPLGL